MGQAVQLGALSIDRPRDLPPLRIKHQDKAAWGVGGKGFFDNKKFWQPGQALYFDGEPNLDFTPLNKLAWERLEAFKDKLDAEEVKIAKEKKRQPRLLPREEWKENDEHDEIPMPQYLMGMPITADNEAIR
jgi:hypothetical protein